MNKKVIQSYVWHEGQCFFVSTINRESSAVAAYNMIYAETMVWRYDYPTGSCNELVWQGEGSKGSIAAHIKACTDLHTFGEVKDEE